MGRGYLSMVVITTCFIGYTGYKVYEAGMWVQQRIQTQIQQEH